jgi:pyruvate dehydrogenase E1 component beta subunit
MEEFAKNEKVIFLGQQVASENFYDTLTNVPFNRRREMPVAEDLQMGLSIGLALEGYLPISIYQRMDFLPRAMDQIVNHLNLIKNLSLGLYKPKVIIRTTIGTKKPLDVGLQHSGDLTELMKVACKFPVMQVNTVEEVNYAYEYAMKTDKSVMIIEKQELYNE